MKKSLFAYLIYFKDPATPNMSNNDFVLNKNNNQIYHQKEQANVNNDASKLNDFLKTYDSCFVDYIPDELPPPRGVDNHRIDLIQGSSSLPKKTCSMFLYLNKRK